MSHNYSFMLVLDFFLCHLCWSRSNLGLQFLGTRPEFQPGRDVLHVDTLPFRNWELMKKRWSVDWSLAHKAGFDSSNMAVSYFDPAEHGESILAASPECLVSCCCTGTKWLRWKSGYTCVCQQGSVTCWAAIFPDRKALAGIWTSSFSS